VRRPDWAKAYSRKGNALHGLRLLDPAAAAYRKALELEPNNAIVAKSLLNCEQLLRDNAFTSSAAAAATSAPKPQAQQQQQQQQQPPPKRQKSKKELAEDDGMSLLPLSERRDPAVWRALSGLSATHGAWLGRGRDASQGTYDSLRLACAWRIQNPRRSARVEGGTRCMSDELDCLKRKGGVAREVWRDMMTSSTAAALEAQGKLQLRAELNEVLLLHGIPRSSLLTVLANGLNERFSGTHAGAAFGNGAYLAEDLGKADQYPTPTPSTTRRATFTSGSTAGRTPTRAPPCTMRSCAASRSATRSGPRTRERGRGLATIRTSASSP